MHAPTGRKEHEQQQHNPADCIQTFHVQQQYKSTTAVLWSRALKVSWLLDTRKDAIKNNVFVYFLVCKGISNGDVGVARGAIFQEIRPGAGFETGHLFEEKLGGARTAVERLRVTI